MQALARQCPAQSNLLKKVFSTPNLKQEFDSQTTRSLRLYGTATLKEPPPFEAASGRARVPKQLQVYTKELPSPLRHGCNKGSNYTQIQLQGRERIMTRDNIENELAAADDGDEQKCDPRIKRQRNGKAGSSDERRFSSSGHFYPNSTDNNSSIPMDLKMTERSQK
jgi:hypothetical protein